MNTPNRNLIPEITDLLRPFLSTASGRDTWLSQAFFGVDPRLFDELLIETERAADPDHALTVCVRKLYRYCLPESQANSLAELLRVVQRKCTPAEKAQIDLITPLLQCGDPLPAKSVAAPETMLPKTTLSANTTNTDERTLHVFVSYSRHDEVLAKRLIADLERKGYVCWFDQTHIKSDEVWPKAIASAINNSYAFVTLVSRVANESKWVFREYLAADEKPNLPIYVVQLEACDIEIHMKGRQATRLYPSYEDGLDRLIKWLPPPPSMSGARRPQRALELDYLSGLKLEHWLQTIQSIEQYQTMAGTAQARSDALADAATRMTPRYKHLAALMDDLTGDAPDKQRAEPIREQKDYTDILDAVRDLKHAVLLGEPGAGKSTTLWRLAKDLSDKAASEPNAPIPILVRLGKWTDADQPLKAFIAAEMGALGGLLDKLITEQRVALLLDGLNEIPTAQRKNGKDAQVQAFIQDALKANPALLGIVSCRERDYTLDLGFDKIEIAPLDPPRIRAFAVRYLERAPEDAGKGETFFWTLAGKDARGFYDEFQTEFADDLPDWENTFWLAANLPDGLEWGYKNWDWEGWLRRRNNPSSLLTLAQNPYMLTMMTDIYRKSGTLPANRGELFSQFTDELIERELKTLESRERRLLSETERKQLVHALVMALSKTAYAMQTRREPGEYGETTTATSLAVEDVRPAFISDGSHDLLYLAASASLLSVTEDRVRFTHQLLQEYFSALSMLTRIRGEKPKAVNLWTMLVNLWTMLVRVRDKKLKAADLWKPGNWWEPTGWEEATILLAGLFSADCTFVLEWVGDANPEVAAQCIVRSGAHTPPETLERLRDRWIPRLTDLVRDPEPRARAAVGRALGLVPGLDNRKGVGLRPDGLPDLDWCDVPAGTYPLGSDQKTDHNPKHTVRLNGFQIARYPITYRQFQAFVDAEDGYRDGRWWEGLHDDAKQVQQRGASEQDFKYWNHPREKVTWYEAMAFCAWLSAKLGYTVRLPTDDEWEAAARGSDERKYAYRGDFDPAKCNTYDTGIDRTSAVGIFPNGVSACGALDMTGNVWEWSENLYIQDKNSKNIINSNEMRVLRGGSWGNNSSYLRAAFRYWYAPGFVSFRFGFRSVRS